MHSFSLSSMLGRKIFALNVKIFCTKLGHGANSSFSPVSSCDEKSACQKILEKMELKGYQVTFYIAPEQLLFVFLSSCSYLCCKSLLGPGNNYYPCTFLALIFNGSFRLNFLILSGSSMS